MVIVNLCRNRCAFRAPQRADEPEGR